MRRWLRAISALCAGRSRSEKAGLVLLGLLLATAAGCNKKSSGGKEDDVTVVPVSQPVSRVVTDYVEFTGQTSSMEPVNIIARVTGYVKEIPFKEGAEVKAGDPLFVIDPRPYQAQYDQAYSQVKLNEAQLDLAKKTLVRFQALAKSSPGSVSEQVLDQYKASVVEAEARLGAQNKSLEVYNLNKEFTHVVSPIDGLAGRYMVTKGNLVNQDQTLLTTVQKLDPMYVYFDMDESTRLKIITSLQEGRITLPDNGGMPVQMGLQNEVGYPHDAILTFMNNQINSTTGSITMRAVFKNPKLTPAGKPTGTAEPVKAAAAPESAKPSTMAGPVKAANTTEPAMTSGTAQVKAATEQPLDPFASSVRFDRQFAPGMFVRVRLPMGEPHPALLIIDRAIQSDQDKKFVYVVDADNKVQSRYIRTLALQEDGLRVVEGIKPDEIKPDDWVVVGAIQQVKAQMLVKPDRRTMPTLGVPSEAVPQSPAPQSPAPVNGQAAPHSSPGDSAAKTPDQPKPSSAAAEKPQG